MLTKSKLSGMRGFIIRIKRCFLVGPLRERELVIQRGEGRVKKLLQNKDRCGVCFSCEENTFFVDVRPAASYFARYTELQIAKGYC